ncbi:MAG TPA: flagellar biosynthesis protein FliQ [Clostridiales bacterium]|nr:flagellar biosynthesis protein FliQ [Clostridiales bacterium]
MTQGQVMEILRDALFTTFKLSAPLLIGSLAVGLIIAVIQAATQIHEQTLTFVPKLITIGLLLLFIGPWIMTQMGEFVERLLTYMVSI